MILQTFLAALAAVEVVGPTLPDSWAETKGTTARRSVENNILRKWCKYYVSIEKGTTPRIQPDFVS